MAVVLREDRESGIEGKELQKKSEIADQQDALSGKHWLVCMCARGVRLGETERRGRGKATLP